MLLNHWHDLGECIQYTVTMVICMCSLVVRSEISLFETVIMIKLQNFVHRIVGDNECVFSAHLLGVQNGNGDLVPIGGLDETLKVAMGGLVRDPTGLLGVVGLGLELLLQFVADNQPLGGVRVGSLGLLNMAGHGEK